ncbi:MAG: hypothetical protein ABIM59_07755, partial [candidate division WOR-3 bacterium]
SEAASREKLFQRVQEVEVGGRKYVIRRPSRREMFDSGVNKLSSYIRFLDGMIQVERDVAKKEELVEMREKKQYEFEKKLLKLCVENISDDELDSMEYGEWYELFNHISDFVLVAPFREFLQRLESRRDVPLAIS